MNISKERDLDDLFELWQSENSYVKKRNLKTAIDTVELNIMYYEDKANIKALARMANCLKMLDDYREMLNKQE